MSTKTDYELFMQNHELMKTVGLRHHFLNQTDRYVEPFRLYGNVWFVGDSWVCVHLIDTGDGLLLIDSGNIGATAMLIDSIWRAGFDPADVKWIIHSHGHLDHIGGSNYFRAMYGTKLYLAAPDAKMFRERPELSFIHDCQDYSAELFTPDVEINDGDVLVFGNTTISCRMVPGHTEGCVAMFFDAYDGEDVKRCGYYGGFGFITLTKEYLREIGDENFEMRKIYLESISKVRDERVEVFLGNHCINNETLERRRIQLENPAGPNPFVDDKIWSTYLDRKRDELIAFMADPANN